MRPASPNTPPHAATTRPVTPPPPTLRPSPSYVDAGPVPEEAFGTEQATLDAGAMPEGSVLVEALYLSVDPCKRRPGAWLVGWCRARPSVTLFVCFPCTTPAPHLTHRPALQPESHPLASSRGSPICQPRPEVSSGRRAWPAAAELPRVGPRLCSVYVFWQRGNFPWCLSRRRSPLRPNITQHWSRSPSWRYTVEPSHATTAFIPIQFMRSCCVAKPAHSRKPRFASR